jgi:acid phosphatase class B
MRSRRISRVLAAWALASAAACAPSAAPPGAAPAPATNAPPAASAAGAPPITLAALRASLAPLKPSTVVFDIDDTTLYTGLAFLFAQGYFEEKDGGRFRDDRAFWTLINDSLDARFSKPKRIAGFAFPAPPMVLFTAQAPKTEAIRSVHPAVSYGDSDGDIADTRAADPSIRAIRIIRSPVSYNERPFQPGRYGEEILANSAD